ncbi:roundabout homolog 2 [Nephila pilipes]|uniref:Roundabout homolog 2 n=1 Tax=Nephila pilipes TaxID=299642 RepID=A0A8X6QTB0_NEPPI|nr:roundabout homolog 2 [Nephila pilipes]
MLGKDSVVVLFWVFMDKDNPKEMFFGWIVFRRCFFGKSTGRNGRGQSRPPRITEHPSDVLIRRHEPATLNCKAEGRPEPTIECKREQDTGTYWCLATNEIGKARSRNATLEVAGQSRPPRITEHPSDVLIRRHELKPQLQAEGRLTTIEWYHDGNRVMNSANRMVLPSGSLFFLHVIQSKREQDTGTYWCLATNEIGKARSRNATLEVAVLREDFRVVPKVVSAAVGDSSTLECTPPKGHPEPNVRWRKDGEVVNTGKGRIRIVPPGNLVISEVRQSDEGRYTCIAENMAGMRESLPVHMAVHVKPFFVKEPEHLTVLANVNVTFPCKVDGDPRPTLTWRRKDGKMPVGRAEIFEGSSLVIRNVNVADEGTYICEAENIVGSISSEEVTLTVHSPPNFLIKPKDQRIGLNGIAKMECSANGNPPPSIFWTKEGNQVLMFPERSYGKFSVSREGTLTISGVSKEDDGYYICSILSGIGSSMAKAYLEVTAIGDLPAPIIKLGPANQTLPLNTVGMLPCEASGDPPPSIQWFVNSAPLQTRNPRFVVLDSGTLQIDSLQHEDSGFYTCTASSESGETSWSASLTVASPRNPNSIFHRMPDSSTYPGPPSKPIAINVSETSVTLQWERNSRMGSSPVIGYTVEYYSSDLQSGWVVVAHQVEREMYVASNLRPDTRYMFLVRAENSHGLSIPSPVSDVIRTFGFSSGVPHYNLDEARNRLNDVSIFLQDVVAISSTAVKMMWKVQGASGYIEGFYIRFLDLSGGSQKYNMVTVLNGGSTSYILIDLKKFTKYEFFLVPFYKNVEGPPSNSKIAQTLEDVPSAPPDNLQVRVIGPKIATISWSPPPPQHRNGLLQGYSIRILDNSSQLHAQITTNATTTSVTLTNLTIGSVYNIKAAALTASGMGPFSPSIHPKIEYGTVTYNDRPTSVVSDIGDIVRQPWFIAVVGAVIFILLSVFFIILFIRRRAAWKKELQAHLSGPVHKTDDVRVGVSARETLWINQAWHPASTGKNCLQDGKMINNANSGMDRSYISGGASDYAEVDTHNMTTFYKKELPCIPAPYATTTLINPSARHHSGSVHDGGKSSGSEISKKSDKMYDMEARLIEDCVTEQLLDAKNVISPSSDSGSYTTDEYGLPVRRKRLRGGQKGSVLNWMEFIPPPPDHPPSARASPTQGTPLHNPYPLRNIHSQIPINNSSNLSHSPQVSRSLQSTALARHTPTSPWSQSLTRTQEDVGLPPTSSGVRYPLSNSHMPTQQSYGSSPGVDRGVQSSLLSLASDPCPGMKKGSQERCAKVNSLRNNPGVIYHQLHPEPEAQERVRYDNVMQLLKPDDHSPESSIQGDGDYASGHCVAPSWTSVTDRSSTSSARSSVASSSEGSVYTDSDFANVVAKAAQNAGFLIRPSPMQPSKLERTPNSSLLSPVHNC